MLWFLLAGSIEVLLVFLRLMGDLRESLRETIYLQIALGILYLFAVFAASIPQPSSRRKVLLILLAALVFRATVWPLSPALSDDVFRYRWEGAIQTHGGNPYFNRPADPQWNHLRDGTYERIPGVDFRAVYGPLTEMVEHATFAAVRRHTPDPFRQAFWFKVPSAVFDLFAIAGGLLLLHVYGLPLHRIVLYAWCPLPLIEFWGTGHNDALTVAALFFALAFAGKGLGPAAMVALGIAGAAKVWPIALIPLFCRAGRWRDAWIAPAVFAAFALPYWPPDYRQVVENMRFASGFVGGWRNNDSLFGGILWLADGNFYIAKRIAFGLSGAVLAALVLLKVQLHRAILVFAATLLAVSANCHAWYLTWMLPSLLLEPWLPLLLWLVLSPLSYVPVFLWASAGQWIGIQTTRWLIYVPVYGHILADAILKGCSLKQRLLMKPR
jgi:hypothetical protein